MPRIRYPWPASAITAEDMALLHSVRETAAKHTPITALVAEAIRACYAQALQPETAPETKTERKVA